MSSTVVSQPATSSLRRKLLWWLPTFLWLCAQAAFSTDTFSAEHTGSILWSIVHWIYPGISAHQFEVLHFLVRKAAHFCTYGILSVFAFYSWRNTLPAQATHAGMPGSTPSASASATVTPYVGGTLGAGKPWALGWSFLAVLTALVAGSLDEFHQTFVPSRTASPRDVLLDVTGAICFQLVLAAILTRRGRQRIP